MVSKPKPLAPTAPAPEAATTPQVAGGAVGDGLAVVVATAVVVVAVAVVAGVVVAARGLAHAADVRHESWPPGKDCGCILLKSRLCLLEHARSTINSWCDDEDDGSDEESVGSDTSSSSSSVSHSPADVSGAVAGSDAGLAFGAGAVAGCSNAHDSRWSSGFVSLGYLGPRPEVDIESTLA